MATRDQWLAEYLAERVHREVLDALELTLDEPPRTWLYEALEGFCHGISSAHESGYPDDAESDAAFVADLKASMREYLGDSEE